MTAVQAELRYGPSTEAGQRQMREKRVTGGGRDGQGDIARGISGTKSHRDRQRCLKRRRKGGKGNERLKKRGTKARW